MNTKILAITLEPVSKQMAGPAIRCVELSRQLAKYFDVTVLSPGAAGTCPLIETDTQTNAPTSFRQTQMPTNIGHRQLYDKARQADILFIQANVLKEYPGLSRLGKYIVLDLYDPYLLSLLPQYADQPLTADASFRLMHAVLQAHMAVADFSICASERQRDYWLGRYCAMGRITPEIYGIDATVRKLIEVVPFGVPCEPAAKDPTQGIRRQVGSIAEGDQVLYWGGGLWQWFDPLTIIRAVTSLKDRLPRLRLVFAGSKSPNPNVPLMPVARQAEDLADRLGVLNLHVFFCEDWIPYKERGAMLLDCDIAVSAHFESIETRFAYRTRILDYLWAGRPVITTCGDELSQLIQARGCGLAVGYRDIDGWAHAIEQLLSDPQRLARCGHNSAALAQNFTWEKVAVPLIEYCRAPYHLPVYGKLTKPSLLARARAVYERGGPDLVIKRSKHLINDIITR